MRKLITVIALLLIMSNLIVAPIQRIVGYRVVKTLKNYRILAYSPKQPREGSKNALNQCAKNERGIAVPRQTLSYGTLALLPNGQIRNTDDRSPEKAVKNLGTRRFIEARWYQSIKAQPKTKAVNRELRKYFDMGRGDIKILEPIYREVY